MLKTYKGKRRHIKAFQHLFHRHNSPFNPILSTIIHKSRAKIYTFYRKILVKYIKLQLFVDKSRSYPQFQRSFQHLTVKIGLKCLKLPVLLKTLFKLLKSGLFKVNITFCKPQKQFLTSIFLQNSDFAQIVAKMPFKSFQHTVENCV